MIRPQRLKLPWSEPLTVARQLAALEGERGLIWLDGDGSALGNRVTIAGPREIICCRGLPGDPDAQDPFAALHQLAPGHWTGWLSYEAAAWCEPGNPWASDAMATLWIARHDPVLNFDLLNRDLWVVGTDPPANEALAERLISCAASEIAGSPAIPLDAWKHHTDARKFADGVRRIRELIADGDLFQANLTACCSTTWPADGSALELFQRFVNAAQHRLPDLSSPITEKPCSPHHQNGSCRWMPKAGSRRGRSKARDRDTRNRNGTPPWQLSWSPATRTEQRT